MKPQRPLITVHHIKGGLELAIFKVFFWYISNQLQSQLTSDNGVKLKDRGTEKVSWKQMHPSLKINVAASTVGMWAVLHVDKFDRMKSWQITAPFSILCPCSNYTVTADRVWQTLNEESVFQLMLGHRTKSRMNKYQDWKTWSPVTLGTMQAQAYQGAPAVTMQSYHFRAVY